MRYLTAEEILVIHDETIEKEGGVIGIRDVGLLYSVAERPKASFMGGEMYPDIFFKAAAYLEGLATYYVFTDGNKRTAFLATAIFLALNGYHLDIPQNAAYSFIMSVAIKKEIYRCYRSLAQKIFPLKEKPLREVVPLGAARILKLVRRLRGAL